MKNYFCILLSLFLTAFSFSSKILAAQEISAQGVVEEQEHAPGGKHVVAELKGCVQCDYDPAIEQVLREAATAAGATVLHVYIHKFDPQGMTGVVVLSESHIAFHTWPEYGYVACDIFTCGETTLPEKALEVLINYFQPQAVNAQVLARG